MIDKNIFYLDTLNPNSEESFKVISNSAIYLAEMTEDRCLECPEKNISLNKIREALFWAKDSMSRWS